MLTIHMPTPTHEDHKALGHRTEKHSPDGTKVIEECKDCGMAYLHFPNGARPFPLASRIALLRHNIDHRLAEMVCKITGR